MSAGLEAKGITVAFDGQAAVSQVDISLRPGEVHAVIGENGAGKSSLGKALAGVYRTQSGTIELDGRLLSFRGPKDAADAGIALIHQEPLVFPDLTVAENLLLGREPKKLGLVQTRQLRRQAQALLESLHFPLDPDMLARELTVARQQMVEIGAALSGTAKVLIFDETTAPLTPAEAEDLFVLMRRLKERGCALAFVSHHLDQVLAISDRITVLRDGSKVAEFMSREATAEMLVKAMIGRDLAAPAESTHAPGETAMELQGLTGAGFSDVSLTLRRGEIVGLAGLVGAGRTEVLESLVGIRRIAGGSLTLFGTAARPRGPGQALSLGVALLPEDRRGHGLAMDQSIADNASLASLRSICGGPIFKPKAVSQSAESWRQRLCLVCREVDQPVRELSGGNQQKVVFAKQLRTSPKVLLLDEPTRGVDIGAKQDVHQLIRDGAKEGMAVLIASSDLPEVISLCDRVYIMARGRLVKELSRAELSEEAIMTAAAGQEGA